MSNYETQILLNVYKNKFKSLNNTLKRLSNGAVQNKYNTGHDFINDPVNSNIIKMFNWSNNDCPNLIKIYLAIQILTNETKLNYNNFLSRKKNS